jgi:transglutaminase-like putative cysteine protease
MRYTVDHKTEYTYREPVSLCHNIARLVPRNTVEQTCRNTVIDINPKPDRINEYEDFFGNKVIYFSIEKEHWELTVNVTSEVERRHPSNMKIEGYRDAGLENVKNDVLNFTGESVDIKQYSLETPMTNANDQIRKFALRSFGTGKSVFEATNDLTNRIYREFEYQPGHTTISTPLTQVIVERKGVCQDFAHLAISCLRSIGLPARYVSGYIETVSPAGVQKLIGTDASHAWFSVYIPDMGWTDFDPTNNCIVSDQHITIGWGRDYADVAPLEGIILSSGSHELAVSVDVKRVI